MTAKRRRIDAPATPRCDHRKRIGQPRAGRLDGDHVALAVVAQMDCLRPADLVIDVSVKENQVMRADRHVHAPRGRLGRAAAKFLKVSIHNRYTFQNVCITDSTMLHVQSSSILRAASQVGFFSCGFAYVREISWS